MITKTGDRITSFGQMEKHLWHGGYLRGEDPDLVYCKRANGIIYAIEGESFGAGWVATNHSEKSLWDRGAVFACDAPTRPLDPEWRIGAQEKRERERRDESKPCIAPNGYRFPIGEELRLHLNEGGFVQDEGREKWYRARANKQEVLFGTRAEWEPSAWDWNDMVRMMNLVACDEPQLSKDIRAREEADAERNARKFMRAFDEASGPPFKEKQMLHRDDGNDVSERDEYAMMFHIYNEQNRQVVFAMTCGDNFQSRSLGLMDAAKLHAALGVWLDQASRTEEDRCVRNRR